MPNKYNEALPLVVLKNHEPKNVVLENPCALKPFDIIRYLAAVLAAIKLNNQNFFKTDKINNMLK